MNPMIDAMYAAEALRSRVNEVWRMEFFLRAALEAAPHSYRHEDCPGCAALVLLDWIEADDED